MRDWVVEGAGLPAREPAPRTSRIPYRIPHPVSRIGWPSEPSEPVITHGCTMRRSTSPPMLPSVKLSAIQGSKRAITRGRTSGWLARYQFSPSAQASINALSQGGLAAYIALSESGSMKSFIRRSWKTADSPSASASRPCALMKFVSTRLKSSCACA